MTCDVRQATSPNKTSLFFLLVHRTLIDCAWLGGARGVTGLLFAQPCPPSQGALTSLLLPLSLPISLSPCARPIQKMRAALALLPAAILAAPAQDAVANLPGFGAPLSKLYSGCESWEQAPLRAPPAPLPHLTHPRASLPHPPTDLDGGAGKHAHYIFSESLKTPSKDPVVLWFNVSNRVRSSTPETRRMTPSRKLRLARHCGLCARAPHAHAPPHPRARPTPTRRAAPAAAPWRAPLARAACTVRSACRERAHATRPLALSREEPARRDPTCPP